MNENDTEIIDSNDDAETTENQTDEVADETTPAEDVDELKKKLATAEAQKEHWRKKATDKKEVVESPKDQSLTAKDTLALIENKVSTDDFDEVIRVAKLLGKPVAEALKDKALGSIIATRIEERKTASATQVKGGSMGVSKVTGEALLEKAESTGEVPDDAEGLQKLFMARQARKAKR
jgi:hypothetical protein